MVYTAVSKAAGPRPCGFESHLRYHLISQVRGLPLSITRIAVLRADESGSIRESSNGRTAVFETVNLGSNPSSRTNLRGSMKHQNPCICGRNEGEICEEDDPPFETVGGITVNWEGIRILLGAKTIKEVKKMKLPK